MKSVLVNWKMKLGALAFYLLVCMCGLVLAFSSGPVPGVTGDFGEPNCTQCHTSFPLNVPGGTLAISGVPAQYAPGQVYPITVTLSKSGQRRWGFELSVRTVGSAAQAGTLVVTDAARTQIVSLNGIQYIEHTAQGTQLGAPQGSWTFNWQAPAGNIGAIRFSAAGNAANGDGTPLGDFIYTTSATTSPTTNTVTGLFAQVAVGGGFTTVFSLTNTGSDTLSGSLILTSADGTPLAATLTSQDASGSQTQIVDSSFPLNIPAGGTKIISAAAASSAGTVTGWGRVESSGGQLSGVATFQLRDSGGLRTVAGVFSSDVEDSVTIQVDDDGSQSRFTGYAVANPGSSPIQITILFVNGDGVVTRTLPQAIALDPGKQVARFLFQDVNDPNFKFQGSVVLKSETGGTFASVALVQDQDPNVLFTAIPVIKGRAPNVGN